MNYLERSFLTEDNFEQFLDEVCQNYNIGDKIEHDVIEIGYEDLNIIIKTTTGIYLLKVLNKDRTEENALWYTEVQKRTYEGLGEKTVEIYKNQLGDFLSTFNTEQGQVYYNLLKYFPSKNLYESGKDISVSNVASLVFDILSFGYQTPRLKEYLETVGDDSRNYDPWSFENLITEYNDKSQYLTEEQRNLVLPFVAFWKDVTEIRGSEWQEERRKEMIATLRRAPIQRDFISTNILSDGKDFKLIDHSIAGITYDFIDLAVFGCDTAMIKEMTDEEYIEMLKIIGYIYYKATNILGNNYNAYKHYMQLVGIQHSLHILNATYLKIVEGLDDPQNQYWIDLGERGAKAIINAGFHDKTYPKTPGRPLMGGKINLHYEKEMQDLLLRKGLSELVNQKIEEFRNNLNVDMMKK